MSVDWDYEHYLFLLRDFVLTMKNMANGPTLGSSFTGRGGHSLKLNLLIPDFHCRDHSPNEIEVRHDRPQDINILTVHARDSDIFEARSRSRL